MQAYLESVAGGSNGSERHEGVCAQWSERGYGFIHFGDGRRAYVHNSQCGGEHLVVGEAVTCLLIPDEKNPGKLQARSVERLTPGLTMQLQQQAASAGYADPAATAAAMAAAVNEAAAAEAAASHAAAEAAAVAALDSSAGLASSTSMANLTSSTDALLAAIRAAAPHIRDDAGASHVTTLATTPSSLSLAAAGLDSTSAGGRQEGVVIEWDDRGFGSLEFPDGKYAYVQSSEVGGEHLVVGEVVTAILTADGSPGKLTAYAVQRGPLGEDGVVTEWREEGGYGFILMDDARRAYVHRSVLGGRNGCLIVGQRLRVRTRPDSRNPGKWCVAEIKGELAQAVPGGTVQAALCAEALGVQSQRPTIGGAIVTGQEADGTVTLWKEEGGYGFLSMDDGRRIYIHRNFFGGVGSLAIGQRLRVTTKPDPRNPGKWCVDQVKGELQDAATAGIVGYEGLDGLEASGLSLEAASSLAAAVAAGGSAPGNSWDELFGAGAYAAALNAAANAQGAPAPADGATAGAALEVSEGVVAEWHEGSGYGFLTMDDSRRVYVHRNAFGGAGSLVVGSRMQVTVKPDSRNPGKWSADQVIAGDIAVVGDGGGAAKRQRQS
eukprot:TRINITY_DN6486_c0_g1_i2.p1 TRINITY_DN6486_c0_g1~~TRINITY_DN6486_c0_g1_i2.p1  ORF type:complete len:623 (+),score=119.54 TRINITY_DN6486_c0_g1_i2:54-1871(+)